VEALRLSANRDAIASILVGRILLTGAGVRRISSVALRRTVAAFGAISLVPGLLVLGAASAYGANEWRLARFGEQLIAFPLPGATREVARSAELGVLTGNGDHFHFVVTRVLASALPLDSLQTHFAQLHPRPAISGGAGGGPPRVEVRADSTGHYVVSATDAPYEGIFDPRCF